ncbi:hypothetical protein Cpir12675_004752 [Ceratocystis pirilliformis]|uniref:Nephrocystin 3-like N-terminal domain-containing protein n=1 Tax=Ceratocystis pirilliformis TaxID=259994 RepID=A0ABR3YU82_9PEZI
MSAAVATLLDKPYSNRSSSKAGFTGPARVGQTILASSIINAVRDSCPTQNRKTFIVIDVLDELDPDEQQELIEILQPKNINGDFQGTLKLLITSREVEGFFDKAETFATCEIAADDKDIAAFIDHQLEKNKKDNKIIAKLLSENPDLKKPIKSAVLEKARSM